MTITVNLRSFASGDCIGQLTNVPADCTFRVLKAMIRDGPGMEDCCDERVFSRWFVQKQHSRLEILESADDVMISDPDFNVRDESVLLLQYEGVVSVDKRCEARTADVLGVIKVLQQQTMETLALVHAQQRAFSQAQTENALRLEKTQKELTESNSRLAAALATQQQQMQADRAAVKAAQDADRQALQKEMAEASQRQTQQVQQIVNAAVAMATAAATANVNNNSNATNRPSHGPNYGGYNSQAMSNAPSYQQQQQIQQQKLQIQEQEQQIQQQKDLVAAANQRITRHETDKSRLLTIAAKLRGVHSVYSDEAVGFTLMHAAAKAGNAALVAALIADPQYADLIAAQDKDGRTPMYTACKHGVCLDVVKALFATGKYPDPNQQTHAGYTFIYVAAHSGHLDVVKYLHRTAHADAKIASTVATDSVTPASHGHVEIVKFLIKTCKAKVNHPDAHGDTALHRAAASGHKGVVELLVESSNASLNARNRKSETAYEAAENNGQFHVAEYLRWM